MPHSDSRPFSSAFLVIGLPRGNSLKDMVTVSVLQQTTATVKIEMLLSLYVIVWFKYEDTALDFLEKTCGVLWVAGIQCHLVSCTPLSDAKPLYVESGTYVPDAYDPNLLIDLARVCLYDQTTEIYDSFLLRRYYAVDPGTEDMVEMRHLRVTNENQNEEAPAPPSSTSAPPALEPSLDFFVASQKGVIVMQENWSRPVEFHSGPGFYTSKKDGKPACGPCRLKFSSRDDLKKHEANSLSHLAKTAPWVDRAKLRRLTAGEGQVVITAKDALETPLDLREVNNRGVLMMKKMGWTHGQSLGAQSQDL